MLKAVNIKRFLILLALAIALGILYYTNVIVKNLEMREKQIANLYAKSIEYIVNSPGTSEFTFIFDQIILAIDFPVIVTDRERNPLFYRNIEIDTTLSKKQREKILRREIEKMEKTFEPIKIAYQDTLILNYVFYGNSKLVEQLKILPYIILIVAGIFVLIGYLSFSYIKKTEQSNIWVGLARETAHQLGTPLSSLYGWLEILRTKIDNGEDVSNVIHEIENDLNKLNKITQRFSKIGSKAELVEEKISDVINSVIRYFEKRIPHSGKKITISIKGDMDAKAFINRELFEWVIENLLKNSLDAIENSEGKIEFKIQEKGKLVIIDVSDTGRGINMKYRKDIFRPGYTTKKRGWGLGLSLSKRIIEIYHGGKLFLKESKIGKGSTFRIVLKK
ncbi:sensor histidine kinase [Candidatus Kryptobacter tengchongensis]|uniref:histidine kinase n=1 Tax=Kryptobacter tengchongensis TaxID=1643429 RepID=A0A916PE58_KRYT1|nr:HAMP domain-containing sensor histidine kinase [Candidatus Kryptobacter tengchongensis]CUS85963.1 Histidine kinase-, DNA gyrase B-, and HSP90-like ATPase [Candidatus Kryptobacter tengchongensis]CUT00412.1 Histidine kinase-, DNA gyrase B-, and HSP90-like ATPase [Candidatus Kryptobacter tengchongensis]